MSSNRRFWLKGVLLVVAITAAVFTVQWWSGRHGRADRVSFLEVRGQPGAEQLILVEESDGNDESPSYDRLVVVDALTGAEHAVRVVDPKTIAITADAVWGFAPGKGLYRWSLPGLDQTLDPGSHVKTVPALAAGVSTEPPCVDPQLAVVRVVTNAGSHLSISLANGLPSEQQPSCGRGAAGGKSRPLNDPGVGFERVPDSERFRLQGSSGPGWLRPQLFTAQPSSPDRLFVCATSMGGQAPLALVRATAYGEVKWTRELDLTTVDQAQAVGDRLLLTAAGRTRVHELATGLESWRR